MTSPSPSTSSTIAYLSSKGIHPSPRHLSAAITRATEIHRRKSLQSQILSHIITLATTLPSSPTSDPAHPSAEDIKILKEKLVPFQPSDFDDLIVERNVEGLCGYALCGRSPRKMPGNASFKIIKVPVSASAAASGVGGGEKKAKVVKKEEYERWCGNECIERAMYLRLQLIEQPSWEREEGFDVKFELLEERREKIRRREEQREMEEKMKRLDIGGKDELAAERGDQARDMKYYDPDAEGGQVRVVEKEADPAKTVARPPSKSDAGAGAIEGYEPKYKPALNKNSGSGSGSGSSHRRHSREPQHEDDEDEDDGDDILERINKHGISFS